VSQLQVSRHETVNKCELSLGELGAIVVLWISGSGLLSIFFWPAFPPAVRDSNWASLVELLILSIAVLLYRPAIWRMSKWRPHVRYAMLAMAAGYGTDVFIQVVFPARGLAHLNWIFVAPFYLSPILEEFFFRGVLVRSLERTVTPALSITIVAVFAALGHPVFRIAVLQQAVLGVVYVTRRNSIAASLICHLTMTVAIMFPVLNVASLITR
jgi:membrane protease YdiL (CAAX protease family)